MVAIKSLVASALLALLFSAAALADNPTLRIDADDQAWATKSLLRTGDLGLGWRGGVTKSMKPVGPACPGFDPKESDLVVTGHANASFEYRDAGVQLALDSQVLETAAAVRTDFARTIQPPLAECLAYQLRQGPGITAVKVEQIQFPKVGAISAAYRATITVRTKGRMAKVISDFVFFAKGRMEYSLNLVAPAQFVGELVLLEADIAGILVKRSARP